MCHAGVEVLRRRGFSHVLVPTDVIDELGQGPGVSCSATDQIRRTIALRLVCERPTFRSETWVEWVGGDGEVALLACP